MKTESRFSYELNIDNFTLYQLETLLSEKMVKTLKNLDLQEFTGVYLFIGYSHKIVLDNECPPKDGPACWLVLYCPSKNKEPQTKTLYKNHRILFCGLFFLLSSFLWIHKKT